jgi:hypothetical protein
MQREMVGGYKSQECCALRFGSFQTAGWWVGYRRNLEDNEGKTVSRTEMRACVSRQSLTAVLADMKLVTKGQCEGTAHIGLKRGT